MTQKFPDIKINETGICNHCHSSEFMESVEYETNSNLSVLIEEVNKLKKQKQGKYDCIIGASGGLDSSYIIYVAKQMLRLNPLVISYNHGFTYPAAINNVKHICKELDIDLRIISSNGRHDFKFIKAMVRGLSQIDSYWGICSFCHYVLPAVVYKTASLEGIPILFTSNNMYEAKLHLSGKFRLRHMLNSLNFRNIWKFPMIVLNIIKAQYHFINLKLEFYLPPVSNLFKRKPVCPVYDINMTQYLSWDIKNMTDTLNNKLGWQLPQHPNINMRFDCRIEDSFINYTYKKATGATVHSIIASNLVNGGVFTKSEMEEAVNYYDNIITDSKEQMFKDLGL